MYLLGKELYPRDLSAEVSRCPKEEVYSPRLFHHDVIEQATGPFFCLPRSTCSKADT